MRSARAFRPSLSLKSALSRLLLLAGIIGLATSGSPAHGGYTITPMLPDPPALASYGSAKIIVATSDGVNHVFSVTTAPIAGVGLYAVEIQMALTNLGFTSTIAANGASVTGIAAAPGQPSITTIIASPNMTGVAFDVGGTCKDPMIAFGGSVTGFGQGVAARYEASISFASFSEESLITYNPASPMTISQINAMTYSNLLAGLPTEDQPFLTLDADGTISFSGTPEGDDVTMGIYSTDSGTSVACSICPEPSSLAMCGIGMAIGSGLAFRRGRRRPE